MKPQRLEGLPPIIDRDTRLVILGSFPSETSLKKQQYYAFSQNQFWPIILRLLGRGGSQLNYTEKTKLLLRNGIGLWDVIHSCERSGSADHGFRQVVLNNLEKFFSQWSNIQRVYLNGKAAQKYFDRIQVTSVTSEYLPSTSPAYAVGLDRKVLIWKKALSGEGIGASKLFKRSLETGRIQ